MQTLGPTPVGPKFLPSIPVGNWDTVAIAFPSPAQTTSNTTISTSTSVPTIPFPVSIQYLPSITDTDTGATISMGPTLSDSAPPPTMLTTMTSNPTPLLMPTPTSTMTMFTSTPTPESINSTAVLTIVMSPVDIMHMSTTTDTRIMPMSFNGVISTPTDTRITPMTSNGVISTRISGSSISSVQSTSTAGGLAHLTKVPKSIIAGATSGAVLLLAVVVIFFLFSRRQRKKNPARQMVSSLPDPEHTVAYSTCVTSALPDLAKAASIGIANDNQPETSLDTDNALRYNGFGTNVLHEKRMRPGPMDIP